MLLLLGTFLSAGFHREPTRGGRVHNEKAASRRHDGFDLGYRGVRSPGSGRTTPRSGPHAGSRYWSHGSRRTRWWRTGRSRRIPALAYGRAAADGCAGDSPRCHCPPVRGPAADASHAHGLAAKPAAAWRASRFGGARAASPALRADASGHGATPRPVAGGSPGRDRGPHARPAGAGVGADRASRSAARWTTRPRLRGSGARGNGHQGDTRAARHARSGRSAASNGAARRWRGCSTGSPSPRASAAPGDRELGLSPGLLLLHRIRPTADADHAGALSRDRRFRRSTPRSSHLATPLGRSKRGTSSGGQASRGGSPFNNLSRNDLSGTACVICEAATAACDDLGRLFGMARRFVGMAHRLVATQPIS